MTFWFTIADKVIGQRSHQFGHLQLEASELANCQVETPLFSYDNLRD